MESLEDRSGNTQPIAVTADDRERDNAVMDELQRREDFALVSDRLDCGDYLVDGRYLFERKTLTDLVLSIESGRPLSPGACSRRRCASPR